MTLSPVRPSVPATTYTPPVRERLTVWLRNALHTHERWAARWLRRKGWVVFYLETQYRQCNALCWLEAAERADSHGK